MEYRTHGLVPGAYLVHLKLRWIERKRLTVSTDRESQRENRAEARFPQTGSSERAVGLAAPSKGHALG
jgi:hypothetical protein